MAWNIPGSGSGKNGGRGGQGNGSGRSGGGGNPVDAILGSLRNMFGGGGGGALRWVGIVVVLWLAFSSFVLITEQQRGVVLRFGHFARVMQPGPNFKLPWPIESVAKVNATQINNFNQTLPVLTRDENIVNVEVNVQYKITDPVLYLFGTRQAVDVLEQAALSAVREQVGRSELDTVLSARPALATASRTRLQGMLDAYQTGLAVTGMSLPNARPPEEVKPAFDDVNSAQQDKDRRVSEARAYAAKVVPEARGEAQRVLTTAEGYKTAAVARARGDADRFTLLVDQYKAAPEVTRKRLWLDTVQQVLADNRKVIGGDGRQLIYVPMGAQPQNNTSSLPLMAPDIVAPTVEATLNESRPERSARPGREEPTR